MKQKRALARGRKKRRAQLSTVTRRTRKRRTPMARKRRRTSRRKSSFGLGSLGSARGIGKMLVLLGTGIAVGQGVSAASNFAAQQFNVPALSSASPFISAFGAFTAGGGGLPGAVAAFVSFTGGAGGGTQTGSGAFV